MVTGLDSQSLSDNNMNSNGSGDFKDKLLENLDFFSGKEEIVTISLEDLPEDVKVKFESYSRNFIYPEDYREGNFEKIGYIEHNFPDFYTTYFATQNKKYDNDSLEKIIYLFEKNKRGVKIGHAEIRLCVYHNDPEVFETFFKDKPFVGFTKTENNFLEKGYGVLRSIHMNKLVDEEFGLKLYSSDVMSQWSGSKRNRQKLVEYGLAKQFLDNDGNIRFSFL